jgi:hypothetical protein
LLTAGRPVAWRLSVATAAIAVVLSVAEFAHDGTGDLIDDILSLIVFTSVLIVSEWVRRHLSRSNGN